MYELKYYKYKSKYLKLFGGNDAKKISAIEKIFQIAARGGFYDLINKNKEFSAIKLLNYEMDDFYNANEHDIYTALNDYVE